MARAIILLTDTTPRTMIQYQNEWHDIEFKVGDDTNEVEIEVEIKGEKNRLIEFIKKEYDNETPEQWLVSDSPISTWSYRIFTQDGQPIKDKHGNIKQYDFSFIGECHYNENEEPFMHSGVDNSTLIGENFESLKDQYEMMKEAFDAPVIYLDKNGMFK